LHARTICHATEDLERVKQALRNVVGEEEVRVSRTEGHHGNPIIVLEASVADPKAIDEFFHRVDERTVSSMIETLGCRIDDGCNLFLKIDKQAAFLGTVQMAQNDDVVSVRIKVNAFPARPEVAQGIVKEHLRFALLTEMH